MRGVCGRFVSSSSPARIAEYFGAVADIEALPENFNVAPTSDIYGVVAGPDGDPMVSVFEWGLIPSWAKDRSVARGLINARSETLTEKPSFRSDFKTHRCIIPMDGFYEWATGVEGGPITKAGKLAKRPHFIHRVDDEPLAVAGIWSMWRDRDAGPEGAWHHTTAIITTQANETIAPVHDRMPVILPRAVWHMWLNPANQDTAVLSHLLIPAAGHILTLHEVGLDVNNVRNNSYRLASQLA